LRDRDCLRQPWVSDHPLDCIDASAQKDSQSSDDENFGRVRNRSAFVTTSDADCASYLGRVSDLTDSLAS